MTTIQRHPKLDVLVEHDVVTHGAARKALAVLRVAFGLTFLWAFFDKLFALGFHTGVNAEGVTDRFGPAAWINGGSPTTGFLKFGVPENNPFKDFFNGMAGQAWADWLFMAGLLGIGLALTLGIGMRLDGGNVVDRGPPADTDHAYPRCHHASFCPCLTVDW